MKRGVKELQGAGRPVKRQSPTTLQRPDSRRQERTAEAKGAINKPHKPAELVKLLAWTAVPASVTTQVPVAVSSTHCSHPCSRPASLLGTCGCAAGKRAVLSDDTPNRAFTPAAAAEASGAPAAPRTQEAPARGKRQRGAGGEGGHGAEQKRRRKAEAAPAAPAPDADGAGGASGAAAAASAGKETKAKGEKQQTAGGTAGVDDAAATPASKAAVAKAKKKQKAKDKRDARELDSLGGVPEVTGQAPVCGSLCLCLPEASRCSAWKGPAMICSSCSWHDMVIRGLALRSSGSWGYLL